MNISNNIKECIPFLPEFWKEQYAAFLEEEHLFVFAKALEAYAQQGIPDDYGLPIFKEEVTPPPATVVARFQPLLNQSETLPKQWAEAIIATPFEHLLVLLRQRWTSASITDERGIPPLQQTLLDSCFASYNEQISVVTRSWEKHMGRSEDGFWEIIKGNPQEKEQNIRERILHMLENKSWWNIFHHYKHKHVYELRVPSGHGIRWNAAGTKLIGFLEPFL